MKPVSAVRSALTSALVGTCVVSVVLGLAILAMATGNSTCSVSPRSCSQPLIELRVPAVAGVLLVLPLLLFIAFTVFFLIGRRAARPIEMARQQQLQFAADASHELRTPLTVIEGEASLALIRPREGPEYRVALEKIAVESRRMRRLVDDLMWLTQADSGPDQPGSTEVDLVELASGAVKRFYSVAASKKLRMSATIATGFQPIVWAPREWMERLIGVLLDNSCRYTPDGGVIAVSTRAGEDEVSLTVEDSGPGIPEAERKRIFDRFHRATRTPGGSGLGLAIASKVVDQTHGVWKVGQSELGGVLIEVSWRRDRARITRIGRL